jgi:hypothetical protein
MNSPIPYQAPASVQVPSKSPSTAATARISHSMPPNAAAEDSARTANLDADRLICGSDTLAYGSENLF